MRYYRIFRHDKLPAKAIKYGFSYPAFFFTCFWALSKRLYSVAAIAFLFGIFIPAVVMDGFVLSQKQDVSSRMAFAQVIVRAEPIPLLMVFLGMLVAILLGYFGNCLLVRRLLHSGYQPQPGWIRASHADAAFLSDQTQEQRPSFWKIWTLPTILSLLVLLCALPNQFPTTPTGPFAGLSYPAALHRAETFVRHPKTPEQQVIGLHEMRVLAHLAYLPAESRWGDILRKGEYSVPANFARAVHWYRVAAVGRDGWAMYQLGILTAEGKLPGGWPAARRWLAHSANVGTFAAAHALIQSPWYELSLQAKTSHAALQRLERAAQTGHRYAALRYAMLLDPDFYPREHTVRKNTVLAYHWMRIAAKDGSSMAEYDIAQAYASGSYGFPNNPRKAVYWWHQAALRGDGLAANNLAYSFQIGNGVPQNSILAAAWFLSSSADGYRPAFHKAQRILRSLNHQQRLSVVSHALISFITPLPNSSQRTK